MFPPVFDMQVIAAAVKNQLLKHERFALSNARTRSTLLKIAFLEIIRDAFL